jgi:Flp pilus assembly pilin Flp
MTRVLYQIWIAEDGQDLIEYTLLIAFLMFTVIGLATGFHDSIMGITSVSNSQISYASTLVQ